MNGSLRRNAFVLKAIILIIVSITVGIAGGVFCVVTDRCTDNGPVIQRMGAETNPATSGSSRTSTATAEEKVVLTHQIDSISSRSPISWGMKLVSKDISDAEIDELHGIGISIVEGEWGMGDATSEEIHGLLDKLEKRNMQLIMNFSEESAWGYGDGSDVSPSQKPEWQNDRVASYVKALKDHKALYGYDISNEAGENLPNGDRYRISTQQMLAASKSVRAIDASRPILMRMHYWDNDDGDFTSLNPFVSGIADVVMLNLYSNWTNRGNSPDLPNVIEDSAQILVNKIRAIDEDVEVWLALSAFRETPHFLMQTADNLRRDIEAALKVREVSNISFFGWGSKQNVNKELEWYLPRDNAALIEVIRSFGTDAGGI